MWLVGIIYGVLIIHASTWISKADEEFDALAFLSRYNSGGSSVAKEKAMGNWNFWTDINPTTKLAKDQALVRFYGFQEDAQIRANQLDIEKLTKDTKRQIGLYKAAFIAPKRLEKRMQYSQRESEMTEIYSSAKVTNPAIGTNLSLNPQLTELMANSRNSPELLAAWRDWRQVTGPKMRPLFKDCVTLANQGAKDNGFQNMYEYQTHLYELPNLEEYIDGIWQELKVLYLELHAYVRQRLSEQYPHVLSSQAIPAHLLGNMWAQNWVNIYPLVEPYSGKPSLDVTKNLRQQNYTAVKMVQLAEAFFRSIGFEKLPGSFYSKSMFEKPEDREVLCHAAALDFFEKNSKGEKDVRIKQCTEITHQDLIITHHEMGHIYYFLKYWDQPYIYRDGANPAFHEALGDTIALSVDTPRHLVKVKLLDEYMEDKEAEINALMKMALSKIAFLPFGYLLEKWRWQVYTGEIDSSEYNKKWWELRVKHQGVRPPISRDETTFDPGSKFHIAANARYIQYFLSRILQFQLHKTVCDIAGINEPLHKCSIYNSTKAGQKLSAMLEMGRSKPWRDTLEAFTGSRDMSVNPLKEYFHPLYQWLVEQRCQNKYKIGWPGTEGPDYDPCEPPTFLPPVEPTSSHHTALPSAHASKTAGLSTHVILGICFMASCLQKYIL
ncbi:angiotensin-converting enzyme [Nematostella vectensis]|uniref:angiotensin-converting enzyme n=1 Tax=Nematostella vectensis TaxID=45351 RepID=UPI00139062DE|nr:angiotensin-converting enzyme [Nematostella vectensis]